MPRRVVEMKNVRRNHGVRSEDVDSRLCDPNGSFSGVTMMGCDVKRLYSGEVTPRNEMRRVN